MIAMRGAPPVTQKRTQSIRELKALISPRILIRLEEWWEVAIFVCWNWWCYGTEPETYKRMNESVGKKKKGKYNKVKVHD